MIKFNLTIDNHLCWGCKTCEVACKQENRAADSVKLIAVHENGPRVVEGGFEFVFHVGTCRHCDDPPCIEACPTGIDIRKGLQYECIGCAACIDGCNQVMDKMGYPKGLVRYTTEHALKGRPTEVVRPRVIIYASLLLALFFQRYLVRGMTLGAVKG